MKSLLGIRAEQTQLSQPVLVHHVLQPPPTSWSPWWPMLDTLKFVNSLLLLGSQMDAVFQM